MAFTKFDDDLEIISKLPDEPNDLGGLTAAELKAEFDKAGKAVQTYINEVLLPSMEKDGGVNIGIMPVSGLPEAANIQTALEKLVEAIAGVSVGVIPDESLGEIKLKNGSVTHAKLAASAVENENIAAGAVSGDKLAPNSVGEGKIAPQAVGSAELKKLSVTGEKLAAGAVSGEKIAAGAVSGDKLQKLSVNGEKLTAGAVSENKIAPGAVNLAKLGEDVKTAFAPAYTCGTWELTPNSSALESGKLYIMYE